jgi:UDP-N-acetylglucosamine diphosphorylase/glucosamine-1-phosphate N-acetyltransferase
MNIVLFDDEWRVNLFPLSLTRPCGAFRLGILTIAEKWEKHLNGKVSYKTKPYLGVKFPAVLAKENVFINGRYLPDAALNEAIKNLKYGELIADGDKVVACVLNQSDASAFLLDNYSLADHAIIKLDFKLTHISKCPDIFTLNGHELEMDFDLLTKGRVSAAVSKSNTLIAPHKIFVEEGVKMECVVLNASSGSIYISKDSELMEGSVVRGPFYIGEHSQLKMGAKIYGPTSIGPHCKVGGEVNNSVIFGYSNKAHDGFIGNSVIGEWCNLGADTNTSNLKNNYAEVKLWNYPAEKYLKTGLQFCGTIMGDHSKCGINTMFNTGTIVGVSANVFGSGFPRNFIPDFSWGGAQGFETFSVKKSFEVAKIVYERRGLTFDENEQNILTYIFNETHKYRVWENIVKKAID